MSSSSSAPITQTRPVCLRQFLIVSLARTSSFCCSSPCTFSAPVLAQDVDQARPPDRRGDDLGREGDVVEQIGQLPRGLGVAVFLVEDEPLDGGDRRLHEAPGMSVNELLTARRSSPCRRSTGPSSARPSVSDRDRPLAIGPMHRDAMGAQPRERGRRGMAVVVPADRDHRHRRGAARRASRRRCCRDSRDAPP